ncbi:MAG: alpha/beta hydrolase, partial [Frankiaceae bacterium]|nr:alpha/beta hydrolase [Arenimonas sp.]
DSIGRGPEAFSLETEMIHIKAPVLLLWCRDDRVIDISASEIFRRGLPNSRTVVLTGCGHMPMMAQPGNVAAGLREFVAHS